MTPAMRFSTFPSLYATQPERHRGWENFFALFDEVRFTPDKTSVPLYCPATFIGPRKKANVVEINFMVIDVDDASEEEVLEALNKLSGDREDEGEFNLPVIFHTTHSHTAGLNAGKFKGRILFPLSRNVRPEEWDLFWAGVNREIDGIADPQCKDPSRMYFFPSAPPNDDNAFVEKFNTEKGKPFDVDIFLDLLRDDPDVVAPTKKFIGEVDPERLKAIEADVRYQLAKDFIEERFPGVGEGSRNGTCYLVAQTCGDFGLEPDLAEPLVLQFGARCTPPMGEEEVLTTLQSAYSGHRVLPFGWRLVDYGAGDSVEERDLKELAKKLSRRAKAWEKKDGRRLTRALKGEPIGEEAQAFFSEVSRLLAAEFQDADPLSLATLLQKTIEATHKGGERDITVEWVAERIQERQDYQRAERAENKRDATLQQRNMIADAFRSVGIEHRTTKYTQEELEEFANDAGLDSTKELNRRWVIRHRRSFYFLVNGEYVERHQDDAHNAARELLSPSDLGLDRVNAQGLPVPLSMSEIVDKYGCVADSAVCSLAAQKTTYEWKSKKIIRATCPFRKLEPKFNPYVDKWIQHLGDHNKVMVDRINDWLASVPMLERPTCALFIHGPRQAGKELMAQMLARLWSVDGPTDLTSLAGNFNEELMTCPLVFGDEFVPTDNKGRPRLDLLRKIIGNRSRTLTQKHISASKLKGAIRLILGANNMNLFIGETSQLTDNDIGAIAERFLCVRAPDSAVEYLQTVRKTKVESDPDAQALFGGDGVAQHVWYLHNERTLNPHSRLIVSGFDDSELAMRLTVGTGLRSRVCEWVTNYIKQQAEGKKQKTSIGGGKGVQTPVIDAKSDRWPEGRLLVNATMVHKRWKQYLGAEEFSSPRIGSVERALSGLSHGRTSKRNPEDMSKTIMYRAVNLTRIKFWAVSHGSWDVDSFDAACEKLGLVGPHIDPSVFKDND